MLDLLLSNYSDLVSNVEVCEGLVNSDHASVHCLLNLLPPKQSHSLRVLYNYSKADFDEFRTCLDNIPWDVATVITSMIGG